MAKKDLSKRDRKLLERLRAKGIGKKLARRIASAPDVDGGKGGKGARKAAKNAARRLEDRGAEAEQGVAAVAERDQDEARDDRQALAPTAVASTPASAAGGPAGGPLREAVEAAGALPHLGVGPGADASGMSSAEVPVIPTHQLPEHLGEAGGDPERPDEPAQATAGASAGEGGAGDQPGEVAADTPPTGEGDEVEDLTSGLTAGGMDLGAVAPADEAQGQGAGPEAAAVDETIEAAQPSAEDAEGGEEAQGGGDHEADVQPEQGGGERRAGG